MAWLTKQLQTAPFIAWSDEQIRGGSDWIHELERELANCLAVVVVLSRDSVNPESFVRNEYLWALERGVPIIPVLIRDCDTPLALARLHRLDFRSDWEGALGHLLKAIASSARTLSGARAATTVPARLREQKAFHDVPLRFLGDLRPDPASIEAARQAFRTGAREFRIEWRREQMQLLTAARAMLDLAANQGSRASVFHGRSPDEIARFISSCSYALREAERIFDHASKRITLLFDGMVKHWGMTADQPKYALQKYLLIVAFNLQFEIASCLLGAPRATRPKERLRRLLCALKMIAPRAEDRWKTRVAVGDYASMQALCDSEEPIYRAMVVRVGDQSFGDYIWAPRSILLSAYDEARRGKMVTNSLFSEYLIPEVEFTSIGSEVKYIYDETITISKIKDESNRELKQSW